MFISPQDVLFLSLLFVSSDDQETSLLILKTVNVEQGGYFLHMLSFTLVPTQWEQGIQTDLCITLGAT